MPPYPIASYPKSARLFMLYQRLPREKKSAISLTELMHDYGYDATKFANERKNLENDLTSLHHIFDDIFNNAALIRLPAWERNSSGKTARFYIEPTFTIDVIDEQTLFFWEMLANYTASYLPLSIQQHIKAKLVGFHKQKYNRFHSSPLGQWQSHLITLPSVLQAPTLTEQVLANIHQAFLQNKHLQISYQNKWHHEPIVRLIYPKGLVFIDNMVYLTGFNPVDDDIDDDVLLNAQRNFAINRIHQAKIIEAHIPDWVGRDAFNLANLAKLGKLELNEGSPIHLVLKVQKYACQHLYERPLSDDQSISDIDDSWNQVNATLINTQRLQDWLVSMSQLAVVIEPSALKAIILQRLQSAVNLYQDINTEPKRHL